MIEKMKVVHIVAAASRLSSTSVRTSRPARSKIWSCARPAVGSWKRIVVCGLNGLG